MVDPLGLDSCYSVGGRIECITGQRPPPKNGVPTDGPLCPIGVGGSVASGASLLLPPLRGGAEIAVNLLPKTLARVVPGNINPKTLGTTSDVFVTDAKVLEGLNSKQIAEKLSIPESSSGFKVIEFPTPSSGVASPVFRDNPGFIGGGKTAGGAPEFVIPNGPIPAGANTRYVP